MGNVHRFADRRMPAPGILGIIAAAAASVCAAVAGHPAESATAGAAFLLLAVWVLLYLRISAPINRRLTRPPTPTKLSPTPAPCNGTGTASSSPEPSCRA
jgi:hypothetical protein